MISIIIPAYNEENNIADCINAVLNQDYRGKYEVIVVDDGSRDNTIKILKKFKKVKIFRQKHKGPAAARNLGIRKAKGEIVIFTDSDCIPEKTWLQEMVKPFKNKKIIGVQGRYKSKQRNLTSRFTQLEIEDRYDRLKKQKYIDFLSTYSTAYKRAILIKNGGFDETFLTSSGEDPELSFRLENEGKMVFNFKAIVYHRHPDNLKQYLRTKFWRAFWRILLYKKYPSKIKNESYTPQTLKFQIMAFYSLILSAGLLFFYFNSFYIFILSAVALFLLATPLTIKNLKKDVTVGILTPFLSFLRTVTFSLGLIYGIIKFQMFNQNKSN